MIMREQLANTSRYDYMVFFPKKGLLDFFFFFFSFLSPAESIVSGKFMHEVFSVGSARYFAIDTGLEASYPFLSCKLTLFVGNYYVISKISFSHGTMWSLDFVFPGCKFSNLAMEVVWYEGSLAQMSLIYLHLG